MCPTKGDLLWCDGSMEHFDVQSQAQPRIGDVIAGKYRLDRVVGAGGMGMVFAATHMELDRMVAVKFVHGTYCQNPEVIARFVREARAVVRIESEHVAKVIDVGHAESGTPYMVMEYLDGEDLSDTLKLGPLAVPDAVDYVIQACAAMQEAHEMGIVHRDLKPANLFLTHRRDRTPLIKVLDFGISKLNDPEPNQAALTNPAMLMGSPAYMSPEQLTNPREVDPRTDLWSLGVILFELLTGRPAFQAQSLPLLMTAIMQQEPENLLQLRPDISPALAAVVSRCLEKSVVKRYQTVSELVTALLPFAPRRSHWNIERISKSGNPPSLRTGQRGATLSSAEMSVGIPLQPPVVRDATRGEWAGEPHPATAPARARWGLVAVAGAIVLTGLSAWLIWGREAAAPTNPEIAVETPPTVRTGAQPGVSLAVAGPAPAPATEVVSPGPSLGVAPSAPPSATSAGPAAAVPFPRGQTGGVRAPEGRPVPPVPAPHASPQPEPKRPEPGPQRNPLQMDIK